MDSNNRTVEFVLGLIGSILGLLGSLIWLLIGTSFWGGFISGINHDRIITSSDYGLGFIISLIQSIITIAAYIISLIISIRVKNNPRKSGVWLLVIGILSTIINLAELIPGILIIVSGGLSMGGNKKNLSAHQRFPHSDSMDS